MRLIMMEEYRGKLINKKYPQIIGKNKVHPLLGMGNPDKDHGGDS